MKTNLLLLLVASVLLTSCDLFSNYGKKVKINDKSTVYYKGDGVTEAEAKKLGDYFSKNGVFDGKEEKAVQLTKDGDYYVVRLSIKEDVVNKDKERYESIFWFWQDLISEYAFDGHKTKVILTDDKFKDLITVDELNKITVGREHYVYLKGNGIKEKEGQRVADSLEKMKFFDYTAGAVVLTKEKGDITIRFMANEIKQNDRSTDYNIVLENFRYIISKYVFDSNNVNLVMIDTEFNDIKNVKEPNDDRKALIDRLINGQPTETYNQDNQTQYTNNQYQQEQTSDDDTIRGGGY